MSEAYMDGWFSHMYDKDLNNPYDPISQARSHHQWTCGFSERHNAVKHGLDLSLDESLYDE